jgi:hypothetical protein
MWSSSRFYDLRNLETSKTPPALEHSDKNCLSALGRELGCQYRRRGLDRQGQRRRSCLAIPGLRKRIAGLLPRAFQLEATRFQSAVKHEAGIDGPFRERGGHPRLRPIATSDQNEGAFRSLPFDKELPSEVIPAVDVVYDVVIHELTIRDIDPGRARSRK